MNQVYNQIKEMATKTVKATGGVKIIGNDNELIINLKNGSRMSHFLSSFCATIDISHLALYFNYTKKYIHCQEKNLKKILTKSYILFYKKLLHLIIY